MKKITKIFPVLLTLLLPSCGANNTPNVTPESKEPEEAASYLVQNGFSNYYIVNSASPLTNETYAASELSYFLGQATDCSFSIIDETKVKETYKYISIGDTAQFEENFKGVDMSKVDQTMSGYFISTKDDNIYIYSSPNYFGYGCLYGVYDLLEKLIGYTYYSDDEIYYETKASIKLLNYDNSYVFPSFDGRTLSSNYFHVNKTYSKRLRQLNHNTNELWCRTTMGHNLVSCYLSPLDVDPETGMKYVDECPNWFGGRLDYQGTTGYLYNRICYCADEEGSPHKGLLDHCAQRLFNIIKANPDSVYFMFGQEDNDDTGCQCELCEKARATWAGTTAGLEIHWMNQLIEKVEALVAADSTTAGRDLVYVCYAYRATKDAPVQENKVNGSYVPVSDKVIPCSKLRIMLGDTEMNYTQALTSPANANVYERLLKWKDIAPNQIILYNYDVNFYEYFMNFPNFSSVEGFYQTAAECGINYMFFNGPDANVPCFFKMRMYVEASLLWNVNQDYDTLAHDFINHYYKDAADDIWNYYETLRDYYTYLMTNNTTFGIYVDINKTDKWNFPKEFIDQLADDVYSALDKIEYLKDSDNDLYLTLRDRVYDEYMTVIYMRIRLYKSYYTNSEISEMKTIWEYCVNKFGYSKTSENGDSSQLDIFA